MFSIVLLTSSAIATVALSGAFNGTGEMNTRHIRVWAILATKLHQQQAGMP